MDHIYYLDGRWSGGPGAGIKDQFGPNAVFSCGEGFLISYFFHVAPSFSPIFIGQKLFIKNGLAADNCRRAVFIPGIPLRSR